MNQNPLDTELERVYMRVAYIGLACLLVALLSFPGAWVAGASGWTVAMWALSFAGVAATWIPVQSVRRFTRFKNLHARFEPKETR